jgi:hypothetical protein
MALLHAFILVVMLAEMRASKVKVDYEYKTSHKNMQKLEWERFNRTMLRYRNNNIHVNVFYHTSAFREHWETVIVEQIDMLDGWLYLRNNSHDARYSRSRSRSRGSVMSLASRLHVILHAEEKQAEAIRNVILSRNISFKDRISFYKSNPIGRDVWRNAGPNEQPKIREEALQKNQTAGEYDSITLLHNHCKKEVSEGRNSVVLYMHNKGGEYLKGDNPVSHWRDLLNSFAMEFPSICLRALIDGYSACGPNYQDGHYSGNFWWAACNHVAKLPQLPDPINSAYDAEFFALRAIGGWPGSSHKFCLKCAYRPFHCQVNHYERLCPRAEYLPIIYNLISDDEEYSDKLIPIGYSGILGKPTTVDNPAVWDDAPCLSAKTPMSEAAAAVPYENRPSYL